MRQFTIVIVVSVLGILLLAGCQESDASQIRKARLVGTENLQLKQELEKKNQQIEELTAQIEALEVEKAKVIEQSGETSIKTLRMLLESENGPKPSLLKTGNSKKNLKN